MDFMKFKLNQNFKNAFKILQVSIETFKGMTPEEQNTNLFLLKNTIIGLISILKYELLLIGNHLNIPIKPSDSIKQKLERITLTNDIILENQIHFLEKIEKLRNKIEHNDFYFPNLKQVDEIMEESQKFLKIMERNIDSFVREKGIFENKLYMFNEKIDSLGNSIEHKKLKHIKQSIEFIQTLSLEKQRDINNLENQLENLKSELIEINPFSAQFFKLTHNYKENLLKNPLEAIKSYWNDLGSLECPICDSSELTDNFWYCKEAPTIKGQIISIKPLIIIKENAKAFLALETWENGRYCFCENFENCPQRERKRVPVGSLFCENCGFYYLSQKEVGIVGDFTSNIEFEIGDLPD